MFWWLGFTLQVWVNNSCFPIHVLTHYNTNLVIIVITKSLSPVQGMRAHVYIIGSNR